MRGMLMLFNSSRPLALLSKFKIMPLMHAIATKYLEFGTLKRTMALKLFLYLTIAIGYTEAKLFVQVQAMLSVPL